MYDLSYLFVICVANFALKIGEATVFVLRNVPVRTLVTSYADAIANFGPEIFHIEGYLVISDPLNACEPIKPPHNDTTNSNNLFDSGINYLVLIKRGKCPFDLKVWNAQNSGYSGAIVFNNHENFFPMGGSNYSDLIKIPSLMIDISSGHELMNFSLSSKYPKEYLVNMISLYSLPLSYILLSLLIVVGASLVVLVISFAVHLCRLWRRIQRGRLSRRHLRQLPIKRFVKGSDPYDTCAICLDDYVDRDKLRLLPCQHAFHMQCIDPWLLRNRRRCPVCNQTVEIPGAPSPTELEEPRTPVRGRPRTIPGLLRSLLGRRAPSATVAPTDPSRSPLLENDDEEENTPLLTSETEPEGCNNNENHAVLTDCERHSRFASSSMSQTNHDDTMLEAGSSQSKVFSNIRSVSAANLDDIIINEHLDYSTSDQNVAQISPVECTSSANIMNASVQPLIFHEPQSEKIDVQDDDPLLTDVHISPPKKSSPN